ncbi:Predicted chitinase [Chitinophaga jiangningensis]|uniref:Predicted chitinase n=1 Tax=Chitinophaga jiangningensis TaxID=1419482 RepID=A0A1M7DKY1_9BACT|nr:PAAR-like protein [Chitinophaga jiangningensis]SHL80181.1 Predicted chitinase [Chitinophaga jiangningensis]
MNIVNQPLHLVCEGALCTCSQSLNPAPVALQVPGKTKLYLQSSSGKPVATTAGINIAALNFNLCKIPDPKNPTPCTPVLQWKDHYENISLPGNVHPLTEKSSATCSRGGKISIIQHGQQPVGGQVTKEESPTPVTASMEPSPEPEVVAPSPAMRSARWEDDSQQLKVVTGWQELSYLHLALEDAEGLVLEIEIIATDNYRRELHSLVPKAAYTVTDGTILIPFRAIRKEALLKDGDLIYARIHSESPVKKLRSLHPTRPLLFRDAPKIREVRFSRNNNPVITARYGDTLSCRIVAQNMCRQKVAVQIKRLEKKNGHDLEQLDSVMYSNTFQVNDHGYIQFDFTIEKAWEQDYEERVQRFYAAIKTESWYSWWQTVSAFPVIAPLAKKRVSPALIGSEAKSDKKTICPACAEPVTMEQIRQMSVDARGTPFLKDDRIISAALPFLNQYRHEFRLDTCCRKAHFLAQLATETRFGTLEENFNYKASVLVKKFRRFRQGQGRINAGNWGRSETSDVPVSAENQQHIANWAYAKINGNGDYDSKDGYRFKGRGFIQLTGRGNYKEATRLFNKWIPDRKVDWEAHPGDISEKPLDAMAAAMIYWRSHSLFLRAEFADEYAVESVSRPINAALDNIVERKRFFREAVDAFGVKACKHYNQRKWQEPVMDTVVVVSGKAERVGGSCYVKKGKGEPGGKAWPVYKSSVFRRMSIPVYKNLLAQNALPPPDYVTYLTRDGHGEDYGMHSSERYGSMNECPPGEYYLNRGIDGQKYNMYISDSPGSGSATINGPDGERSGIAIHGGWPIGSIGCLTTHTNGYKPAQNALVQELHANIPELDKAVQEEGVRHVRIILEPREVVSEKWYKKSLGDTKWTGLLPVK